MMMTCFQSEKNSSERSHCSAAGSVSDDGIARLLSKTVTFKFACGLGGDTVKAALVHDRLMKEAAVERPHIPSLIMDPLRSDTFQAEQDRLHQDIPRNKR